MTEVDRRVTNGVERGVVPSGPQAYPHPRCCYRTHWGTWFVQLRHRGERYYLGTTQTVAEAVALRDAFLQSVSGGDPDIVRVDEDLVLAASQQVGEHVVPAHLADGEHRISAF